MTNVNKDLAERLDVVIEHCAEALTTPNPYVNLQYILECLQKLKTHLLDPTIPLNKDKWLGAIGKLTMDDMSFAESPLGYEIFDITNSYADMDCD